MSFEHFQYTFVNGMTYKDQRRAYDEVVVLESFRVGRGALSASARVDFKKAHSPLLMIAGEIDHIMPASLNKTNFKCYRASSLRTDLKEFPGKNQD